MMRRGPIDRYPIEWVLDQVARFGVSGTIELNTDHPATLFVRDGALCLVLAGIVEEAPDGPRGEVTARRSSVEVLAGALGASEGWYYHHALGGHRLDVPWRWEVSTVVAEAKAGVPGPTSGGRWDGARVELRAGVPGPIAALGVDAWSVVVAMAAPAEADALAARLGWPRERVGEALEQLAAAQLLAGPSVPAGPVDRAPTLIGLPAPPSPARRLDGPPSAADDRRGALRRLISSLRAG